MLFVLRWSRTFCCTVWMLAGKVQNLQNPFESLWLVVESWKLLFWPITNYLLGMWQIYSKLNVPLVYLTVYTRNMQISGLCQADCICIFMYLIFVLYGITIMTFTNLTNLKLKFGCTTVFWNFVCTVQLQCYKLESTRTLPVVEDVEKLEALTVRY